MSFGAQTEKFVDMEKYVELICNKILGGRYDQLGPKHPSKH